MVCHFKIYGDKYDEDFNAVLKDIKLCLNSNDEQLKYVLNAFLDVRNAFGHHTLSNASISMLKKLLDSKTIFIELLKEIDIDLELVNSISDLLDIL